MLRGNGRVRRNRRVADGAAYALERRHPAFAALFAVGCGLSSAYGFAIDSLPFGLVEALWAVIALNRIGGNGTYSRALRR